MDTKHVRTQNTYVRNNAHTQMPMAGLGTWQYNSSVAEAAVLAALNMGYTHIDTALGE